MAAVGNTYLTLADLYKSQNPDGTIATVIELLAEQNRILDDALAIECNNGTNHLTTVRTGLPSGTWRQLYQGVQPTKSTKKQVTDTTGMLEDYVEIDRKLVQLSRNPAAFRLSEAKAHLMGMNQDMASTLVYGNTESDPEKFMGLAPRFDDTSAANGNQIIDGSGSGADNTSIWFVTWGEDTVHLLYPEGTEAGLKRQDLGEQTKENSDGSLYQVVREHFEWDVGLSVRDWRAVSRIANIDVSDLTKDASSSSADLIDLMIDAEYQLDNAMMESGTTVIYTGRTVAKFLHKQALNASNVQLSIEEFAGRKVPTFLGHPIRRLDAITETESQVT